MLKIFIGGVGGEIWFYGFLDLVLFVYCGFLFLFFNVWVKGLLFPLVFQEGLNSTGLSFHFIHCLFVLSSMFIG